jgi:hypothetical protein
MSRASNHRRRFERGPLPIVIGAVSAALLLAAWHFAVDPDRRSPNEKFDPVPHRFIDVEGATSALDLAGDESADALLIAGDSRTVSDISLRSLARAGIEPTCFLWTGFAQLDQLLRAARTLPQRRMLVCLDPTSVYAPPTKRAAAVLAREREKRITARIDERIDDAVDVWRQRNFRTLKPSDLYPDVEKPGDPNRLVGMYAGLLGEEFRAQREEKFDELRRDMRAMRDAGWRIVCVRLPAAPQIETVEEEGFPGARFKSLCDELGFPFLDMSGGDYDTEDGTHAVPREVERVTAQLAVWLRAQLEWNRGAR